MSALYRNIEMNRQNAVASIVHRSWGLVVIIGACASLAACGLVGPEEDRCREGGEFISLGCAIVRGVVTDSAGEPAPGVSVGPRVVANDCCSWTFDTTDQRGEYSVRIDRFSGIRSIDSPPDTLSIYVRLGEAGLGWLDSVPALITLGGLPVNVHEVNVMIHWR